MIMTNEWLASVPRKIGSIELKGSIKSTRYDAISKNKASPINTKKTLSSLLKITAVILKPLAFNFDFRSI